MGSKVFFLSSKDSEVKYRNNTYYDFVIELPRTYDFSPEIRMGYVQEWVVTLTEISITGEEEDEGMRQRYQRPIQNVLTQNTVTPFAVLCDVAENSLIYNKELPILRTFSSGANLSSSLGQPYPIKVARGVFNTVRIYLLQRNLSPIIPGSEGWPDKATTTCTLHFSKH